MDETTSLRHVFWRAGRVTKGARPIRKVVTSPDRLEIAPVARLGRMIRDFRRKIAERPQLESIFEAPLVRAVRNLSQRGWKPYTFCSNTRSPPPSRPVVQVSGQSYRLISGTAKDQGQRKWRMGQIYSGDFGRFRRQLTIA